MTKEVLSLAIIGYSEDNDRQLIELIKSAPRLILKAIHADSLETARQAAKEHGVSYYGSICRLINSPKIDGLIVSSDRWIGLPKWNPISSCEKPVLLRSSAFGDSSRVERLYTLTQGLSSLILPELFNRWTPSTLRLRELLATRLGPLNSMKVVCQETEDRASLIAKLDWCLAMIQEAPLTIVPDQEQQSVSVQVADSRNVTIVIDFQGNRDSSHATVESSVTCKGGVANLFGADTLAWECGGPQYEESLEHERSSLKVCLDLFGRRIAGGIVPIPDLGDAVRAHHLAAHILTSLETGKTIECSGPLLDSQNSC
ncbi:hypothetical protein KOR42_08200 [Thalassoglobus neptunius]|uniref:Gfo/Idh/MocA-like oxidoreductase N-terminal domain-containing protein n=1 Tax=Thalassoglobus neptunius TaxID=1938619 RepID=A0A5C5X4F0_9PLAN|nr:hypothetical protein [Thalassoglobus neptunius]TWT57459.1 hypothetical protein KOR42_08200 [Thalassoglobus neptunius]